MCPPQPATFHSPTHHLLLPTSRGRQPNRPTTRTRKHARRNGHVSAVSCMCIRVQTRLPILRCLWHRSSFITPATAARHSPAPSVFAFPSALPTHSPSPQPTPRHAASAVLSRLCSFSLVTQMGVSACRDANRKVIRAAPRAEGERGQGQRTENRRTGCGVVWCGAIAGSACASEVFE